MKKLIVLLIAILLVGCATTRKPTVEQLQNDKRAVLRLDLFSGETTVIKNCCFEIDDDLLIVTFVSDEGKIEQLRINIGYLIMWRGLLCKECAK